MSGERVTRSFIESGYANKNACYSRENARTVLYYLLQHRKTTLADWLLSKGARANCILRWQFVVEDRVMKPMEILRLMERNQISLLLKSDDGLNYNLMHYMCYFGEFEGVKKLFEISDSQSLLNDPTESNDIALTMALLSPLTTDDCKVQIASLIYASSNLSICNRLKQTPPQLTLLMGKIDLLFKMLAIPINLHQDGYHNNLLHLAIKAQLPTVARVILEYCHFGALDQVDASGDSVLTLAMKAGDEELACSILREGADAGIKGVNWMQPHSEKDLCIHQALKRKMGELANLMIERGDYLLCRDTSGNLPIHLALLNQLDSSVQQLLARGDVLSFVNVLNEAEQDSPLHLALKLGCFEHALGIMRAGANVNSINQQGYTPCHVLIKAARGDYKSLERAPFTQEQITQLLVELLSYRPDIKILCKDTAEGGSTSALHMAICGGKATENAALLLLESDPNAVMVRDYQRCTPLIRAVEMRNLLLVRALCEQGAELDVINVTHNTALHIAVANNDEEIVAYLVNHGAYLRVWNEEGLFPMHIAIQNNNVAVLSMLCPFDVDANICTREGVTPFILACLHASEDCAHFLIQHHADPYLLDRNCKSCLARVAERVEQAPTDLRYASIAQMVVPLAGVFQRECFSDAASVDHAVQVLEAYIEKAVAAGVVAAEEVIMPRMSTGGCDAPASPVLPPKMSDASTLPPRSVSSATSTLRLPPPLPPTSQPPVGTLKKNATLKAPPAPPTSKAPAYAPGSPSAASTMKTVSTLSSGSAGTVGTMKGVESGEIQWGLGVDVRV